MMGLVLAAQLTLSGTAVPMAGDGPGCRDKDVAARLAALEDTDPAYIDIWAAGMQDRSCRGYSAGQAVTVDEHADGMACVRAAEDEACFWVRGEIAPSGTSGTG